MISSQSLFTISLNVLVATTSSALFGMETFGVEKKQKTHRPQLCFYVNNMREIESCSAHSMKFYKEPSEFLGKDITSIVPYKSSKKRGKMIEKFRIASTERKIVNAKYAIKGDDKDVYYETTITPLYYADGNGFYVIVRNAKKKNT